MITPLHTLVERAAALGGDLPESATKGTYRLDTVIMVNRNNISEEIRNAELPEWFPAVVIMPPENEPRNWYRWYDPFIWYETEMDLSNGGD